MKCHNKVCIVSTSSPIDDTELSEANNGFSSITGKLVRSRAALSLRFVMKVPASFGGFHSGLV